MRWLCVIACLSVSIGPILGQAVEPSEIQYFVESVAGSNNVGDGSHALSAQIGAAEGLAFDATGDLYIADNIDHRIRKVDLSRETITSIAGNGHSGAAGDGGPAGLAQLSNPYGLAFDSFGTLYIADFGNGRVRAISPDGDMRTVVGDEGTRLMGPRNVAVDPSSNLYVSDFVDHRIYQVAPNGAIEIVAGTGNAGFNGDGIGISTHLNSPAGLAVARDGSLWIADSGNNCIRKLTNGILTTVLGGIAGGADLAQPTGVAVDGLGNLYIADSGNRRVLLRDTFGRVRQLSSAEGGIMRARDVAVSSSSEILVADGRRVVEISVGGFVNPVAGDGRYGASPEGALAIESSLRAPAGLALDGRGNLYIADEASFRVRNVDALGRMTTLAGNGEQGYSGDFGNATEARLMDPVAVAADSTGTVWIADYLGNRVRLVNPSGRIITVAGDGVAGYSLEPAPARSSSLNRPRGLAFDSLGNLYIADTLNHRIRRVGRSGTITTVAGNGVRGYSGDGGLASRAQFNTPAGVAFDAGGALYIADQGNHVIRKVSREGLLTTVAGSGIRGYGGDGGPARAALLDGPTSVAVDADGSLIIADTNNHRIRRVSGDGVIDTIAGSGIPSFAGDGGVAIRAAFRFPSSVAVADDGSIYVADLGNRRVRRLCPSYSPPVIGPVREVQVLHAASFESGPVAPGQIVSIFGEGIGPEDPAAVPLTASGSLSNSINETEVRVNGLHAPLFYAGGNQVNAQVPYAVAEKEFANLEVFVAGKLHSRVRLEVRAAVPGLFTLGQGAGPAVALNRDGSLNSPKNRAQRGTEIVLYATGEGLTTPSGIEGQPARPPLPAPILPVHVRIGGLPVEVLYAGAAPGFAGLMQLNVRIPSGFVPSGELPVELYVGSATSQSGVTISVR